MLINGKMKDGTSFLFDPSWSRLEERREERREKRREAAERQPVYVYQPYYPYRYYTPGYYVPGRPGHRPVRPGPTIRRQATALDELALTGPRPYSINSTAHHQRVSSSAGAHPVHALSAINRRR